MARKHLNPTLLERQLKDARQELERLEQYLLSSKFHNEGYVYIKTDLLPRLAVLKRVLREDV